MQWVQTHDGSTILGRVNLDHVTQVKAATAASIWFVQAVTTDGTLLRLTDNTYESQEDAVAAADLILLDGQP